jgi:hypothetical protein
VSTPGDLLFHIRAGPFDLCFEFATQVMYRLAGWVTVCDEVHGLRYFDERDLIGTVDGTESLAGRAAAAAALAGAEDPDFAGGSYVIVQKYVHDMRAWNALPVEEQEKVIGRTKLADIEMPDEVKPANSHVALNTIIEPDGTQRQILRANMPFGQAGRASSAPTSSATPPPLPSPSRCWSTCSSAGHPATTTGSLTSPPRSPAGCSSRPRRTSSTTWPARPIGPGPPRPGPSRRAASRAGPADRLESAA